MPILRENCWSLCERKLSPDICENYVIIYRVLKEKKEVHIITVRYTPSNF